MLQRSLSAGSISLELSTSCCLTASCPANTAAVICPSLATVGSVRYHAVTQSVRIHHREMQSNADLTDRYPGETTLRRRALEKLGQLSANTKGPGGLPGLSRLCDLYPKLPETNGVNGTTSHAKSAVIPLVSQEKLRSFRIVLTLHRVNENSRSSYLSAAQLRPSATSRMLSA